MATSIPISATGLPLHQHEKPIYHNLRASVTGGGEHALQIKVAGPAHHRRRERRRCGQRANIAEAGRGGKWNTRRSVERRDQSGCQRHPPLDDGSAAGLLSASPVEESDLKGTNAHHDEHHRRAPATPEIRLLRAATLRSRLPPERDMSPGIAGRERSVAMAEDRRHHLNAIGTGMS